MVGALSPVHQKGLYQGCWTGDISMCHSSRPLKVFEADISMCHSSQPLKVFEADMSMCHSSQPLKAFEAGCSAVYLQHLSFNSRLSPHTCGGESGSGPK